MTRRRLCALALQASFSIVVLTAVTGCGWQQPKQSELGKDMADQSAVLQMSAKDLVSKIVHDLPTGPLGISIDSVKDGTILTGFKEYEGAIHIVRRWRERTRFRIEVAPDFNEPTHVCRVAIFEQTEEKPSDPQPWYPNPDLRRPERSGEMLKAIIAMAPAK